MAHVQRVVNCKILSGLGGVKDVSFGPASPEQRRRNDYSKKGVPTVDESSFDDYKDRMTDMQRSMMRWL